ncbi:phosphoribosyl-AMP cyclohydrolase [Halopseudomonas pachastrellae]|nr:phosphoribosyl-AMP cyclohydrolase [Halopseudomonas pachastrellae]
MTGRRINWDADGLVPAIAQDVHTHQRILMMAWMNREALQTDRTGRPRHLLVALAPTPVGKGEESGNVQQLHELRLDCDADVVILQVEQIGGIACHTGRQSCFYRVLKDGQWQTVDAVIKDPKELYEHPKHV